MTKNPNYNTLPLTPGVLSVIPILYVAWSDSVLSPSEVDLINKKIGSFTFLTEDDKKYIQKFFNPQSPPTAETFRSWQIALKEGAKKLTNKESKNLVELGLEMAKSSIDYKSDELYDSPKTVESLIEIQEALGVGTSQSIRLLLGYSESSKDTNYSFDVEKLRGIYDGKYQGIKDEMRTLLRDPYFAHQNINNKEEYRQRTLDQLKTLAKHGYTYYAFPKEFGGLGKEGEHISIFEMLAYHDLSLTVKMGVQLGLFGGAIYGLGTEKHHNQYLEPTMKMDLLGCFAMTETNHGSNVRQLETTAHYQKETQEFIIHTPHEKAGKEYIGNALHCHKAVVFAQLIIEGETKGVHAFIVDVRDENSNLLPGVRVEDCGYKMGLNGVDNGKLWFDKVSIPRENLLNKYGDVSSSGEYISSIKNDDKRFFTMLGALITGRVSVGLAGLNAAKTALTIAVKYGLKRRQFSAKDGEQERLIMDYPSHQHRIFPLVAKNVAYYFALDDLLNELVLDKDGSNRREIETKAAGLKAMSTWLATETIQECREACGGKGYLSENRFTDLKADSDIFTTFEGDNTVLLQLVAKSLLTNFRKGFGDGGFNTIMRFILGQVGQKFEEFNPITSRKTDVEHLSDPAMYYEALSFRETKLLYSVSQRMRNFISKRIDPYEAYLKCQIHLIELAKAYVHRLGLKAFYKRIIGLEEGKEKEALWAMYRLYAVDCILEFKGWYLENDFMTGAKTKALRRYKAKLLQEIRPDIQGFVEAYGIPEELLGAKIVLYN